MMNFVFGTVAGGLIACVGMIAAVRQPEIQSRLGLFPVSAALLMPAANTRSEPACVPLAAVPGAAVVGQPDMLFSKRRFWFVAP